MIVVGFDSKRPPVAEFLGTIPKPGPSLLQVPLEFCIGLDDLILVSEVTTHPEALRLVGLVGPEE